MYFPLDKSIKIYYYEYIRTGSPRGGRASAAPGSFQGGGVERGYGFFPSRSSLTTTHALSCVFLFSIIDGAYSLWLRWVISIWHLFFPRNLFPKGAPASDLYLWLSPSLLFSRQFLIIQVHEPDDLCGHGAVRHGRRQGPHRPRGAPPAAVTAG